MLTIKTLSLAEAQVALDAAQDKAEELGVPESLCVADASGYPIALRRLDGGKVTSVQIALNKAFTAAGHRRPTHQYKNALPGEVRADLRGRPVIYTGLFCRSAGSVAGKHAAGDKRAMRPFLLSVIVAVTLATAAAALLNGTQQRAYEAYATSGTRVSDPGHNLVGPKWSGEPSGKGS